GAHWRDPAWQEVLLLLIAMLHGQGTPITSVIDHVLRDKSKPYPYHVATAARFLGEVGSAQNHEQGQRVLAELAEQVFIYTYSTGAAAKPFVAEALGAFADLAAVVTAPDEVRSRIALFRHSHSTSTRIAVWQMDFALRADKERLDFAVAALKDPEEAV